MQVDLITTRKILASFIIIMLSVESKLLYIDKETTKNKGITCWTCPAMKSNTECNDWAPDLICPGNKTVCKTVHRFDRANKSSLEVNKLCVMEEQCKEETVGCNNFADMNETECVSCCNISYCNTEVPFNISHAWMLSTVFSGSESTHILLAFLPTLALAISEIYYDILGT